MRSLNYFVNLPNPYSLTMALGLTQPLTEMGTRKILGCKGRPARKADNLTAICEPITKTCEDNIKMEFKEIGWKVVDWVRLAQDMNQ
jgi:hypothetical protein